MFLLEALQRQGQPVGGHAGIRADPQGFPSGILQLLQLFLQRFFCIQQALDGGQKLLAGRGEGDSGVGTHQKLYAHFLLQGFHHVGQTRLCIAQNLGGFGKTAQLGSNQKRFQFFRIHSGTPVSWIFMIMQ